QGADGFRSFGLGRRPVEPAAFGVPASEGAAAGGVGGARGAGVSQETAGIKRRGALRVAGFQAASEFRPGVAARSVAGRAAAKPSQMRIQGTMASLGHAPV